MTWIGNSSGGPTCQVPRELGPQVAELLQRFRPPVEHEKRTSKRHPIPYFFELFPRPGKVPDKLAQQHTVIGKDISERGIGFFHQKPIPYRHGLLEIELPSAGLVQLEVDILWCRFTSSGWYESGGRLLSVTSGLFFSEGFENESPE